MSCSTHPNDRLLQLDRNIEAALINTVVLPILTTGFYNNNYGKFNNADNEVVLPILTTGFYNLLNVMKHSIFSELFYPS